MIAVLATPTFVAAAQVGDGAVVVSDGQAHLIALTNPTKGEFANQTEFLIGNPTVEVTSRAASEFGFRAIAVFTDGLERLSLQMPAGAPHPGFFTPLFRALHDLADSEAEEALTEFLNSPRIAARSDDDKTLLVADLL